MTARVKISGFSQLLLWAQRCMFACAFVFLGYCGVAYASAWMFQRSANAALTLSFHPEAPTPPLAEGDIVGRIEIPRLAVSVVVVEGTGEDELQIAAGHIAGTGLPGKGGNVGIAAHRDTFFRPLRNIRENDSVLLTTRAGTFHYRVVSARITEPTDVEVLKRSEAEVLTLVTCYPFYFVGPAPQRFIVRAERVS
jgi:sortase A